MLQRLGGALGLALFCLSMVPATRGLADSQGHYLVNDYGTAELVRNVLPAGQYGDITGPQQLQMRTGGAPPAHLLDQQPLYDGPTQTPVETITPAQFLQFTKPEVFGIPASDIDTVETPRADVTIVRDKSYGVPHIFGTTRSGAKFGAGYATAEDRLYVIDLLRHFGRGNLASFLGSSGFGTDCGAHYATGYDAADEQAQITRLPARFQQDGKDFADGVNAFVSDPNNASRLPGEYSVFPLMGTPTNPAWSVADTLAVAALIGGQLGKGGGAEAANTLAYKRLLGQYGADAAARSVMQDFHAADDPESPTTIDTAFPYEARTGINPASVALIDSAPTDPNGCRRQGVGGAPIVQPGAPLAEAYRQGLYMAQGVKRFLQFPHHQSNALVIGAAKSVDGHPMAVFGAQVGYYVPEIFMEMDIHAPDFDARGIQFPGTGVVVELGRGQDFAWSATSAGGDNVDQRVERLCNPQSADPLQNVDPASTNYFYKGKCLPMVEKTLTYTVPPSPGTLPGTSPDPSSIPFVGTETFQVERAVHDDGVAIIQGRTTATFNGVRVPVAVSTQRTNFLRELDQIAGFDDWNTPSVVHDAASFLHAASKVETTFNWLYVDDRDIAYYQSGRLPDRAPGADPDLLTWATGDWDWQGMLSEDGHPHAINPAKGWMTSWNNRPAPHFNSSDDQYDYGSLYRNQMLDREIVKHLDQGGGKMSLVDLFNSMATASVTDFRAQRLSGNMLAVLGPPSALTAQEQQAVAAIAAWHAAGDLRQDVAKSGTYAHADGISMFDSWYPLAIHAMYSPWLGTDLGGFPKTLDNPPDDAHRYGGYSGQNVGSSFDGTWIAQLDKDLRQVLGQPVTGAHSHVYCGGAAPAAPGGTPTEGTLASCRTALLSALDKAIGDPPLPGGDGHWTDLAAMTADDRLDYRSLGIAAIPTSPWSNKPTQQQQVEFLTHRDRGVAAVTPPPPTVVLPNTSGGVPLLALLGLGVLSLAWVARSRFRPAPGRRSG